MDLRARPASRAAFRGWRAVAITCAFLFFLPAGIGAAQPAGQTLRDVAFSDYGKLSTNAELVRRLVSPLAAAQLQREVARSGKRLAEQAVTLTAERFLVYVPARQPAAGYGLLVFVPPWQDARLPDGWAQVLDEFGLIYVCAARSGNDESVLGRREPLALLAAWNLMQRYAVDAQRVYVAGFSGGARVALRLALGYPDLFRGALLNAGSDPIGSAEIPLPPRDLWARFQDSVRLVYLTGDRDESHVNDDLLSQSSMRHWCAFNVDSILQPHAAHEVAAPAALSRALGSLARNALPDQARLAACRSALERDLAEQLHTVEVLIDRGEPASAQKRLKSVDERYGGLASPRSVELASRF